MTRARLRDSLRLAIKYTENNGWKILCQRTAPYYLIVYFNLNPHG